MSGRGCTLDLRSSTSRAQKVQEETKGHYIYVHNITWGSGWVTFGAYTNTYSGETGADHSLVGALAGPWADTSAYGVVRGKCLLLLIIGHGLTLVKAAGPSLLAVACWPGLAQAENAQEQGLTSHRRKLSCAHGRMTAGCGGEEDEGAGTFISATDGGAGTSVVGRHAAGEPGGTQCLRDYIATEAITWVVHRPGGPCFRGRKGAQAPKKARLHERCRTGCKALISEPIRPEPEHWQHRRGPLASATRNVRAEIAKATVVAQLPPGSLEAAARNVRVDRAVRHATFGSCGPLGSKSVHGWSLCLAARVPSTAQLPRLPLLALTVVSALPCAASPGTWAGLLCVGGVLTCSRSTQFGGVCCTYVSIAALCPSHPCRLCWRALSGVPLDVCFNAPDDDGLTHLVLRGTTCHDVYIGYTKRIDLQHIQNTVPSLPTSRNSICSLWVALKCVGSCKGRKASIPATRSCLHTGKVAK